MYPRVGLAWKKQFLVRWKCNSPWKVIFVKLRKAATV